ncbi:hypothetical protein V8E53_007862 [Lactarius tabidus]
MFESRHLPTTRRHAVTCGRRGSDVDRCDIRRLPTELLRHHQPSLATLSDQRRILQHHYTKKSYLKTPPMTLPYIFHILASGKNPTAGRLVRKAEIRKIAGTPTNRFWSPRTRRRNAHGYSQFPLDLTDENHLACSRSYIRSELDEGARNAVGGKHHAEAGLSFQRHVGNAQEGKRGNSILKGAEADEDEIAGPRHHLQAQAKKPRNFTGVQRSTFTGSDQI